MDFELVSFRLCPFVQRAAIVLLRKEIPFRTTYVDLAEPPAWFRDLSPDGKVPLVRIDGARVLFESTAINEFLDEVTPGRLLPEDPFERAEARAWIEVATACLWHCRDLTLAADAGTLADEVAALRARLDRLEAGKRPGPWFLGGAFSLVDAAAAPLFLRLAYFDSLIEDLDPARTPGLAAWSAALRDLPEVRDSVISDFRAEMDALVLKRKGHLAALLGGTTVGEREIY